MFLLSFSSYLMGVQDTEVAVYLKLYSMCFLPFFLISYSHLFVISFMTQIICLTPRLETLEFTIFILLPFLCLGTTIFLMFFCLSVLHFHSYSSSLVVSTLHLHWSYHPKILSTSNWFSHFSMLLMINKIIQFRFHSFILWFIHLFIY